MAQHAAKIQEEERRAEGDRRTFLETINAIDAREAKSWLQIARYGMAAERLRLVKSLLERRIGEIQEQTHTKGYDAVKRNIKEALQTLETEDIDKEAKEKIQRMFDALLSLDAMSKTTILREASTAIEDEEDDGKPDYLKETHRIALRSRRIKRHVRFYCCCCCCLF